MKYLKNVFYFFFDTKNDRKLIYHNIKVIGKSKKIAILCTPVTRIKAKKEVVYLPPSKKALSIFSKASLNSTFDRVILFETH